MDSIEPEELIEFSWNRLLLEMYLCSCTQCFLILNLDSKEGTIKIGGDLPFFYGQQDIDHKIEEIGFKRLSPIYLMKMWSKDYLLAAGVYSYVEAILPAAGVTYIPLLSE